MPGDVSLSGIEFTIKGTTDQASASIDKLISNLSQLNTALSNSANIAKASNGLKALGDALKGMGGIKALTASLALRELGNASKSLDGIGKAASALKSFGKMAENQDAIAATAEWLSKISLIDFSNLSEAAVSIKAISSSAKNIAAAGSSTAKVSEGIKDIGKSAKSANSPLSTFLSSIKRIAFYRIIRSVIKSITEAFSEGLKNAYEWSRANSVAISSLYENASEAMADFKNNSLSLSQSLDLISTVSQTMKNQLGAAFGTLLQSLTPIITYLIRLITSLASAITRLLAIIGGKSTWLQAVDFWGDWGDAASGAGGAAKEALRYLAPFDELNRLPDAKAGGGGGGADSNFGDMFQEVPTDIGSGFLDTLTEAFQNVAAWFEGMDWQELGSKLWDSLKTVFTDGTKANECVNAFFEAIGSAFGAVAGFAWGFIKDAAVDLITGFVKNIKDYDGDSKITAVDLLMAVLKTGGDIVNWVAENIVNPFMNGFVRALTGDNSFDFATWFEEVVLNGLKRGWNKFAELMNGKQDLVTLPTFEIEAEVETIKVSPNVGGYSLFKWNSRKKSLVAPLEAVIEKIRDATAGNSKTIGDCTADVQHTTYGNLPENAKKVRDCIASIFKVEDKIPIRQKTFGGKVEFSAAESKLTAAQRTFAATAQFTTLQNWLGTPKFASRADFKTYLNQLGVPEVASKALIRAYDIATHLSDTTKNLIVASILDIVGQRNIPTVKAYVRPETGSGGGGPTFDLQEGSAPLNYSMGNESEEGEVLYRAMVRALNEPGANGGEITLDGDVIYRAVLNRNKARLRAYGTNPMLTT